MTVAAIKNTGKRLRELRQRLNMSQQELASVLGVGKSALSMVETGKAALSERNKNILTQQFNASAEWLDTGRGEMFNSHLPHNSFSLRTDNSLPLQSVPLYNLEATAGLSSIFTPDDAHTVADYIHIPNLPRCDGAVHVVGDSMYPILNNGDIIMFRQLRDIRDILWGDMYLLSIDMDGEEYIVVKYVHRSDNQGYLRLVSENKFYGDKDVEISRIRAIALVKASIRMNSR